jgi:hypothetical protein
MNKSNISTASIFAGIILLIISLIFNIVLVYGNKPLVEDHALSDRMTVTLKEYENVAKQLDEYRKAAEAISGELIMTGKLTDSLAFNLSTITKKSYSASLQTMKALNAVKEADKKLNQIKDLQQEDYEALENLENIFEKYGAEK